MDYNFFLYSQTSGPGASYEEPKIKAIDIAALLQEKYAFLSGEWIVELNNRRVC